jgi:PhnO protein
LVEGLIKRGDGLKTIPSFKNMRNQNNIIIRNAKNSDEEQILILLQELIGIKHKKRIIKLRKIYYSLLKDRDCDFFVVLFNKTIIGFLSILYREELHHIGKVGYIAELIISKKYRNLGIGKKLVSYALSKAKRKDCVDFEVSSGFKRKNAHKFYKKLGFLKRGFAFVKLTKYSNLPLNLQSHEK